MLKGGVGRAGLALPYVGGTGKRSVLAQRFPAVVTDRLQFFVDASYLDSYPGSGETWFDLSGNNFHLTKDNSAGSCIWNSEGYFQFSGGANFESQEVNIPLTSGVTLNTCYSQTSVGGGSPRILETLMYGKGSASWSNAIAVDPDGSVRLWLDDGDVNNINRFVTLDDPTTYAFNEWRMLTITFDGSTAKLYVNGVLKLVTSVSAVDVNDVNIITIAALPEYADGVGDDVNWLGGNVSSAMIYDKALSAYEVRQNYNAFKDRFLVPDVGIVLTNLVFNVDAGDTNSYPGTGTTWNDISTSGIQGTLYNNPVYEDGAFVFNGIDTYATFPNNTQLDSQNITVEVWVKTENLEQNGFWFEKGAVNTQYSLFQEWTGFKMRTTTSSFADLTLNPAVDYLNTEQWFQVVGTWATGVKKIYVNGMLAGETTQSGTLATNSNGMSIGAYGGTSSKAYFYKGKLSICRVYRAALSAEQIAQNFNSLRRRFNV